MSTNDEIRKAAEAVVPTLFKKHAQSVGDHWVHEKAITENCIDDFVADLLTAVAPYLAPHPAQQGEDGELLEWIEDMALAGHGAVEIGLTDEGDIGIWLRDESIASGADTTIRGALLDAAARSHSKQEGGA